MRKDAKIALIVILALMVLVVVIWGRSPRVDEQAGVPRPPAEAPREPAPAPATVADADLARSEPDAAAARSAGFPGEGAMINQFSPDRAVVRHDATAGADTRATTPPAATPPAPTRVGDSATPPPAPAPPRPAAITHTVARGDTLMKLAAKYYNDQSKWRLIQQANRGVSVLQVGQKITIPPLPDTPARAADTPPATTTTPPAGDRPAPERPPATRPAPVPAPAPSAKTYTVQKGDTFMKIARTVYRDPAKWRTLYERNRLKLPDPTKPDSLRVGTIIELPAVASSN